MNAPRAHWIDNLKALGIFLVVAGHSSMPDEARRWLRAFNMPMFLMISGFLLPPGAMDVPFAEYFRRRVWPVIKFYVLFALLGMASYIYVFRHELPLGEMMAGRLRALAYGTGSTDSGLDVFPVVLWYFPCAIVARLISFFVWGIPSAAVRIALFLKLGIVAFFMKGLALPWEFESALPAAGFFAMGHCVRLCRLDRRVERLGRWHWFVTLILIGCGSLLAMKNVNYPDLRSLAVGDPLLALFAMLFLSAGMPLLSMKCPSSRLALAVSSATILIFPVHMLIFPYIDRVAVKLGVFTEAAGWYGWAKALAAVAFLASVHFSYTRTMRSLPVVRFESRLKRFLPMKKAEALRV